QVLELLLRNLLANVIRHLALEVRIRLNDIPALGHEGVAAPNKPTKVRLADRQHQGYEPGNDLVGQQEEQAGQDDQYDDHDRRDHDFVPAGPGDLADFRANLLEKLDRVRTGHGQTNSSR